MRRGKRQRRGAVEQENRRADERDHGSDDEPAISAAGAASKRRRPSRIPEPMDAMAMEYRVHGDFVKLKTLA